MNNTVNKKTVITVVIIFILFIIVIFFSSKNGISNKSIMTSANISNSSKKIGWGVKRNSNHEQPDLGRENRNVLEDNNGIAIGNSQKKYVYLTFDEGYEAGYTEKILDILKGNNVNAAFFLTAHYVNTQEDSVRQMINEGHIVGNHSPHALMDL